MQAITKYPRTRHIQGSRLQPGDEDLSQVAFDELRGRHLVIEEKVDGAQMGISFTAEGQLRLQSRGHFLTGGSAFEAQFGIVKAWAQTHRAVLREILGSRYIMYGECLYASHTVFYDALPHYFLEFDVWDCEGTVHLSTDLRRILFDSSPVVSVPVLHEGPVSTLDELVSLVRPSLYKTARWKEAYERSAEDAGVASDRAWTRVDRSDLAEGVYVKWEEDGQVVRWLATADDKPTVREGRYKWVRSDFHQRIPDVNDSHHGSGHVGPRTIIPNQLAAGVDIFAWGS